MPIDSFKIDQRRARSGLTSLIPTTTGSAKAIAMIFPELKGKLKGHAVRVPLLNGSLTDAVFELKQSVTVEQVNDAFKAASEGALKGILGYEERTWCRAITPTTTAVRSSMPSRRGWSTTTS